MGRSAIDELTLSQKVGQLFFIGISGPEIDSSTASLLDEVAPGGVCLFARNIKETRQTHGLLNGLREVLPVEPLLSVDQEGGLVDRLRRIITPMPAANLLGSSKDALHIGGVIGEVLRILGFNMDFAPVVDVVTAQRNVPSNGLFSRAYGHSPEKVIELAKAFIDGLSGSGIIGCLKHFPGLGAARVDSHEELPFVDIDTHEFQNIDLYPYRDLSGYRDSAVMVAHAAYPGLDLQEKDQNGKLLPSSLSKNIVEGLLRADLGFNGLVITDDLEMGAIVKNYGIGEACRMAFSAGVDMLAICAGADAVREGKRAMLSAVEDGEISISRLDASLDRIGKAKAKLGTPLDLDQSRLDSLSQEIAALNSRLAK